MDNNALDEISELIRVKEKELHDVYDFRSTQMEQMIKEKDAEISMFIKQFETVKDDFGYNLKLLDARDDEIKRLSGLIMELKNKNHTMESDIQNMSSQIHSLLQHEKEMREKKLIETATNKQLLKELSEEMESLRWTMNDEINAKNREVDQLRHDIKICQMQRDDALESQRLDLTNTFEGILTQRENEFHQIEKQINSQVNDLEKKFESLTTENMKLKSDVSASARQMEGLTVEGQAKDDRCRSMQWQLKDFMQMAQSEQTELNSKIQQLQFVIDTLKDEKGQMSNAFEMDVAKLKGEVKREKENHQASLSHWSELRDSLLSEKDILFQSSEEGKASEAQLRKKIQGITDKYDLLSSAHSSIILRNKEIELTLNATIDELRKHINVDAENHGQIVAQLNAEINFLRNNNDTNERVLEMREKEHVKHTSQLNQQIKSLEGKIQELIETSITNQSTEMEYFKIMEEAKYTTLHEKTLSELNERLSTAEKQMRDAVDNSNRLKESTNELKLQLQEEITESAALRLRLQLLDTKSKVSKSENTSYRVGDGFSNNSGPIGYSLTNLPSYHDSYGNIAQIASPMFSEDLGPVSIPNSPSKGYREDSEFTPMNEYEAFAPDDISRPALSSSHDMHTSSMLNALKTENNHLKGIIREIRQEAERLQLEMKEVVAEKSLCEEKCGVYEKKVQQSAAEITRLMQERQTLMDISNELRSTLYRERSKGSSHINSLGTPKRTLEAKENVGVTTNPIENSATPTDRNLHDRFEKNVGPPDDRDQGYEQERGGEGAGRGGVQYREGMPRGVDSDSDAGDNPWGVVGHSSSTSSARGSGHATLHQYSYDTSKGRGHISSRQTPSQKAALEKLKALQEHKLGRPTSALFAASNSSHSRATNSSSHSSRKVVNYAKLEDFEDR